MPDGERPNFFTKLLSVGILALLAIGIGGEVAVDLHQGNNIDDLERQTIEQDYEQRDDDKTNKRQDERLSRVEELLRGHERPPEIPGTFCECVRIDEKKKPPEVTVKICDSGEYCDEAAIQVCNVRYSGFKCGR